MSRSTRPFIARFPADPEDRPAATQADADLETARRSFLRTVSHELRTPLNAIIGFSEILAAELYGPLGAPQYRDYSEHIRQSGYRLLRLVNQVLEIARLQPGPNDLTLAPQSLDHALDDVADQLRQDLRTSEAALVIEDVGALPPVLADPRGLRTLLFNLAQNAVLHGGPGGRVEISARRRGDQIEIAIRDHGEGVDPDDLHRLLAPFEQGDDTLTRRGLGAGLGLPIARLLVEAMNGRLTLSGAPGEGLTASVTLPTA